MPRYVWPQLFVLYGGGLNLSTNERNLAVLQAATKEAIAILSKISPASAKELMHADGIPVALRWCTRPDLGFPRQPFKVWRRTRGQDESLTPLAGITPSTPFNVNGEAVIDWGLTEMYELVVQVAPAAGNTLTVEAWGQNYDPIPGQRLVFNAAGNGILRAPGTAAVRITGQGAVTGLSGIDSFKFANLGGWQLIEIVGLPYAKGEVNLPVYSPEPQGPVPPTLPGDEAARVRLEIARLMHQPLPPTGIVDFPAPAWPLPNPNQYLNTLRAPALAPLPLITECLTKSTDFDPAQMQVNYVHSAKLSGIRQADMPGAAPGPDPANTDVPVVGTMMLSAGSDSFAAAGLGYGTTDFPPPVPAPAPVLTHAFLPPLASGFDTAFDYMVTNVFIFPYIGPVELAALVQSRPLPETPAFVAPQTDHLNRAPHTDDPETEVVKVQWNLSTLPQGYGILASHKSGDSQVLNSPRRTTVGGYNLYIPLRPATATSDGAPPPDIITTFVEHASPVPLSGSLASRYLVIGCDVFGRWSNWRLGNHSVSAPPVTKPAIHSASFVSNVAGAVGRVVPGDLEIIFSWDWSDRSPDRIEFTGRFFPWNGTPDASFTTGLALKSTGPVGAVLVVKFNASGDPLISSGPSGTVEHWDDAPVPGHPLPANTIVRRYRLVVHGFSLDFTAVHQVAYELYARGAEKVRPAELSDLVGADGRPLVKVARLDDPLPSAVPSIPVNLQWTALPDSTGKARGVLSWPAAANATGYVVWEATESAVRHLLGQSDPPVGTSLLDRAASLQTQINANQDKSQQAFSRVNTKVIAATRMELELPGSANTIYAYRVSSVSQGNQESARSSSVAFMAVPRQNRPGQPKLLLRKVTTPNLGVDVIVTPGAGAEPAGYRIHRVQLPNLVDNVGLMGPAKVDYNAAGWRNYDVTTLEGSVEHGRAFTDPVVESWQPYFYRVVAVGKENLTGGEYRGESHASAAQKIVVAPATLVLDQIALAGNAFDAVLTFRTNLPVKHTSLGPALIEVFHITTGANNRAQRTLVLSIAPEKVVEGPALTVLSPLPPLPPRPGIPFRPRPFLPALPEINRRAPDAQGRAQYTVRMKATDAKGVVVITDPLGRKLEGLFPA